METRLDTEAQGAPKMANIYCQVTNSCRQAAILYFPLAQNGS